MTKSRTLRKAGAVVLSLAMAFSVAGVAPSADAAAKKPALSAKKGTITVGKTKAVKIQNTTAKKVKKLVVSTSNKKVATVTKKSKVKFIVTGKKAGTAKITAKVTLKKAVAKKKVYTLKYTATVKKAATPTTAPDVTATPGELALDSVVSAVDIVVGGSTKYLVVKFNQKLTSLDKSQIEITRVSDGQLFAVDKVDLAADGMSAQVTLLGDQATAQSTMFIKPLVEYNFKVTQNGKAAEKKFIVPVTYVDEVITAVDVEKKTISSANIDAKDATVFSGDLYDLLGVACTIKYDGTKVVGISQNDKLVAYGTYKVSDYDATTLTATLTDVFDSSKTYKTSTKTVAGVTSITTTLGTYKNATTLNAAALGNAGTLAKDTKFVYAKLVGANTTVDRIWSVVTFNQAQLAEKVNNNYITGKLGANKDVEKNYTDYKFIKDNKLTTIASVAANDMIFADTTNKFAVIFNQTVSGKVTSPLVATAKVGDKEFKYTDLNENGNRTFVEKDAGVAADQDVFKKLEKGTNTTVYYNVNGTVEFVLGDAGEVKTNTTTYVLAAPIKGYELANEKYVQLKALNGTDTKDYTGTNGIKLANLKSFVVGANDPAAATIATGTVGAGGALTIGGANYTTGTHAGDAIDITVDEKGAVTGLKVYSVDGTNGRAAIGNSKDVKSGVKAGEFATSDSTPVYVYTVDTNGAVDKVTASTLATYSTKTIAAVAGNTFVVGDATKKEAKFIVLLNTDVESAASTVSTRKKVIILGSDKKDATNIAWLDVLEIGKDEKERISAFDQTLTTTALKTAGKTLADIVNGEIVDFGIDAQGKVVVSESNLLTTDITIGARAANTGDQTTLTFNGVPFVKTSTTRVLKVDASKATGYDTSYDWDKAVADVKKITAAKYAKAQDVTGKVDVLIVTVGADLADADYVAAAKAGVLAAYATPILATGGATYTLPTATQGCTFAYAAGTAGTVVTGVTTAGVATLDTMTGSLVTSTVVLTITKGSATDTVTFTFADDNANNAGKAKITV